MANVQLENGYTKVSNQILEMVAKIKLSPTQYRLLFVIWRFTYGFHRKEHSMSLNFLSEATGCDYRQIQRELKRLEERNIIFQKIEAGICRKISFNKNYDEWLVKLAIGKTNSGPIGENVNGTIGETDNQERNKKISKEKDDQKVKSIPYLEYEKFFGTPPPILAKRFIYWIEESQFQEPEEIICEAIRRAKIQTPKYPGNYIKKIINDWINQGLFTLSAVKKNNAKFDSKLKYKKNNIPSLSNMFDRSKNDNRPLTEKELQELHIQEDDLPF